MWNEDRVKWYEEQIDKLMLEAEICNQERFYEISVEINNYQTEINNLKGGN